MRIHYLQHVPFEDAGNIVTWAREHGHILTNTALYDDAPLPTLDSFDWLVVMGGPMNIYEHDKHPWLVREKAHIAEAIACGKTVLGVCLGAQLIADVLGGSVTRNREKEIGWHPVSLLSSAKQHSLFADWPTEFVAFHWHGDTFAIPPGAIRLAGSQACANQAFLYGNRVLGLQFHVEYSASSISAMLQNCPEDITEGRYVQPAEGMLDDPERIDGNRRLLFGLLDRLAEKDRI